MFLRPRLLSADSLDLRVLNIEAFKSESVSTMLNALNIYARSAEIRLHLFFCATAVGATEGIERKKNERRENGWREWKDARAIRDNIPFWLRGSPSRRQF